MKLLKSNYFRAFMRFLFSHIGLCFLVFVYCVLGAFLFLYFESDLEVQRRNETNAVRCAVEMKRDALIEKIQTAAARGDLREETLKKWLDDFHNRTMRRNETMDAYWASRDPCDAEPMYKWTLPSAVLFTVTTVAAIGYGNIFPTTDITQFILICYSLIGIPLTLMFLANIGSLFATVARFMFSRGVCVSIWKLRIRNHQLHTVSHALGAAHSDDLGTQTTRTNSPADGEGDDGGGGGGGQQHHPHSVPDVDGDKYGLIKKEKSDLSETKSNVGAEKAEVTKSRADAEKQLQVLVPKSFIFGIMAFYTLIGTMLFSWSEDWSNISSAYFNVVTLLTIGLGDYVPGWNSKNTINGQVKMCLGACYIMLGLGILFMGLNLVIDELMNASKRAGKRIGLVNNEERKKPMSNLERAVRRQVYF